MSLEYEAGQEGAAAPDGSQGDTAKPDKPARDRRRTERRRKPEQSAARSDGASSAQGRQADHSLKSADTASQDQSAGKARSKEIYSRAVYSAIDLGTNNCRLLVARPTRGGFRVVDAFSRIVRLGEGLSGDGALSEAAMDRTVEALKICAQKIERRQVTCMRHVATEACRVATNSDLFLNRIKAETGINIDIISPAEEARLAVLGCQSLISPNNRNALVFDIGGGSTEIVWVKVGGRGRARILGWISVPWGVVNLTEQFGNKGHAPGPAAYNEMIASVSQQLQPFYEQQAIYQAVENRRVQFLGTSGTVTTLASLHFKLPRYDRNRIDGAWVKPNDMLGLAKQVASMSHEERVLQPSIGHDRADLVVAGCAILEAILDVPGIRSLRVADRGIREGILRGLMQEDGLFASESSPGLSKARRGGQKNRSNRHRPAKQNEQG